MVFVGLSDYENIELLNERYCSYIYIYVNFLFSKLFNILIDVNHVTPSYVFNNYIYLEDFKTFINKEKKFFFFFLKLKKKKQTNDPYLTPPLII